MKRKYNGYAQSVGFDPIQAPDTTRRIAEQDARMLRGMEAQRSAIRQNRDQYSQGLANKNQQEQQNREQINNYDRNDRRRVQEARNQNSQMLVADQSRMATAAAINRLQPLAEFSESLSKVVTGYEEARSEQAMMEAYNQVMEQGLPTDAAQQQQQLEGIINAQDEQIQQAADGLVKRGAGPDIVFGVRSLGKSQEIGRTKALISLAGASYGDWLADQFNEDDQTQIQVGDKVLTPATATDPADRAAVRSVLRGKFLKQNGLFGAKPALLADGLAQMRQAEMDMARKDRLADAQARSDARFGAATEIFEGMISSDPGTAATNFMRDVSRTLDKGQPLGMGKARDMLFEKLKEGITSGVISQDVLDRIEETPTPDQPTKTYGERFRFQFAALREEVENELLQKSNREEANQKASMREEMKLFRQNAYTNPLTKEQFADLAKSFMTKYGEVPAELQAYGDKYTVEAMDVEELEKELDKRAREGTLTSDLLNDPRIPLTTRDKFVRFAQAGDKAADNNPGNEITKKAIEAAIKNKFITASVANAGIPYNSMTEGWAASAAYNTYKEEVTHLLQSGTLSPEEAQETARKKVMDEIAKNDPGSRFFVPDKAASGGEIVPPEFPYFMDQLTGSSSRNTQAVERSRRAIAGVTAALDNAKAQYGSSEFALDRMRLIPEPLLKKAIEDSQLPGWKPPAIAYFISEELQHKISPYEVMNRQLAAQKLGPLKVPDAVEAVKAMPSWAQQILNRQNVSYTQARRAILSSEDMTPFLNLVASQESNGYGGYDAMNTGGSNGGDTAHGSANSRNVFDRGLSEMTVGQVMSLQSEGRLHAAGRYQIIAKTLNGLMNGAYGKLPIDVNAKFDASTQDVLATALARNRISKGGDLRTELRNEWNGLKNISNTKLDQMIQVLQQTASSPYRLPGNMSARLVYHIGSRGYGSTGPHLDVKPVVRGGTSGDPNQRISKQELDNYVSVEKGGKLTPISMGTVTTDDDTKHRNRGSFGHDFAAPSGTGVYLKNGARVVSNWVDDSPKGGGSNKMIIELPDGRRYAFIHGTAAKGANA